MPRPGIRLKRFARKITGGKARKLNRLARAQVAEPDLRKQIFSGHYLATVEFPRKKRITLGDVGSLPWAGYTEGFERYTPYEYKWNELPKYLQRKILMRQRKEKIAEMKGDARKIRALIKGKPAKK